jgi:hypothetical protein
MLFGLHDARFVTDYRTLRHGTWQINEARTVLRLRTSFTGTSPCTPVGYRPPISSVPVADLYHHLGRSLAGQRLPILKRAGPDVYIGLHGEESHGE